MARLLMVRCFLFRYCGNPAFTEVGQFLRKPRTRVDFQEDFRQIDPWEAREDSLAEFE